MHDCIFFALPQPKTKYFLFLFLLCCGSGWLHAQPCPTLSQTSTLTSSDCAVGITPCTVCPGDQITLTTSGTGLQPGTCIDWYFGTTPNFNPYIGQGTLMGCAEVQSTPPNPCNGCPSILGIFINACGTEANNELMLLLSGSGFFVNDMDLTFNAANTSGSGNQNINGVDCSWQEPTAGAIASIQTICPGATIVGAGPGESVPSGVPVVVFTSSSYNFNYNFGSLCPLSPVIYVMQNGCDRTAEAFTNAPAGGTNSTTIGQSCGCNATLTYNVNSSSSSDGGFVVQIPPLPPLFLNAGCGFPPLGGGGGGGGNNAIQIPPFTFTIPASMCNGGPYWARAIVNPLQPGCAQVLTNSLAFNVPCPMANLLPGPQMCASAPLFNLTALQDPAVPNGTWSGPGVSGVQFNPNGLNGLQTLTFTPSGPCATPTTTTILVQPAPSATFDPIVPVCFGEMTNLVVNLDGQPNFSFNLFAGSTLVGSFTSPNTTFTLPVTPPSGTTVYSIQNLQDALCAGPNASQSVTTTNPPVATLSLNSPNSICEGTGSSFLVNFTSGTPPFSFTPVVNGIDQAPVVAFTSPVVFNLVLADIGANVVSITDIEANGCPGVPPPSVTVTVLPERTPNLLPGNAVCSGGSVINLNTLVDPTFPLGLWSGPGVSGSQFNPAGLSGVQTLTFTSFAACTLPASTTIEVLDGPTAAFVLPPPFCEGEGTNLVVNFSGQAPFNFSIFEDGTLVGDYVSVGNSFSLPVTPPAGSVVYSIENLEDAACEGIGDVIVVTPKELPVVDLQLMSPASICLGENSLFELTFVAGAPSFSFQPQINGVNQQAINVSVPNAVFSLSLTTLGTNTITVTNLVADGCQQASAVSLDVDVSLPTQANLLSGPDICSAAPLYNLSQLADPLVPNGTWSGPGVTNGLFNPANLISTQVLTFTPNSGCSLPSTTTVEVTSGPEVVIAPVPPICAGQSVDLSVQLTGQPVFNFGFYMGNVLVSTFNTINSLINIPITPPGNTNYSIQNLTDAVCAGTGASINVTTLPSPTVSLALDGTGGVCGGVNGTFSVGFNGGTGPFSFIPTLDGVPQTPVTSNTEPIVFPMTLPSSGVANIALTNVIANGCTAVPPTPVVLNIGSAPTATLSGGGQICQGGPGDSLTVTFTGTGPWTFVYSINNVNQPPITTSQNPYKIFVNPIMFTTYRLVSVSDPACVGTVSGVAQVFVFAASFATLSGDQTFCDSAVITLNINVSGTAPFTLTYSVDNVLQAPITISEGPVPIPINITQTTVYSLVSIQSPGCIRALSGTSTITINKAPTYSNPVLICNPAAGTYTVQFNALNAALPLTVVSGGGSFVGTLYTSPPIPLASNYNVVFRDVNNCGNVTVSGLSTCNCTSNAGTMNQSLVSACVGTSATAVFNNNATLDGTDILRYILHSNPSLPLGTIFAWSNTPSFAFGAGMQTGTTYYISSIVGNNDGSGQVDLNDPCRSVSIGTPVIWNPLPSVSLSGTYHQCEGATSAVPLVFNGAPPFTVNFLQNGVANSLSSSMATFNIAQVLNDTTVFQLTQVTDAFCPSVASGTATVFTHSTPKIDSLKTACSAGNLTYTVTFQANNLDRNTAVISGISGTFDASTGYFASNSIPVGTPFTAVLEDAWLCGKDSVSGNPVCSCITNAGNLNSPPLNPCFGAPIIFPAATGSNLEANDILRYLLTDSPSPASWNVLATSTTPAFSFPPSIVSGNTYYVVAMAGNNVFGTIDPLDPCIGYSNAIPVVWRPQITAVLSGMATICAGDTAQVTINFAGGGPVYAYTLVPAGQPGIASSANVNQAIVSVIPTKSTIYTLSNIISNGCQGVGSGQASVTVEATPTIVNAKVVCDPNNLNYTLQFGITNGAAPNPVYAVTGINGTLTDSLFTSISYPLTTPYNVVVTTPSGCSYTLSGVPVCNCTTDAGTIGLPIDACSKNQVSASVLTPPILDQNDTSLFVLCTDPAILPLGILAYSNSPMFGYQSSLVLGQTYYIVRVVTNRQANGTLQLSDPCLTWSNAAPVHFYDAPNMTLAQQDTTVCAGSNLQVVIGLTGNPVFQVTFRRNGILQTQTVANGNAYTISLNNINTPQTIELVSVDDAYCQGTSNASVQIGVSAIPKVTLSGGGTICAGDSAFLTLQISNTLDADIEILRSNDVPLQFLNVGGQLTFAVSPGATTTYTIGDFVANDNFCTGTKQGSVQVAVAPIALNIVSSMYNGYGIRCSNSADGSLQLTASGGSGTYTYLWNTGDTTPSIDTLRAGAYSATVTDQNGCTGTISAQLTQPPALQLDYTIEDPTCKQPNNGQISISTLEGGIGPYRLQIGTRQIDSNAPFPILVNSLLPGTYPIVLSDANGCKVERTEEISTANTIIVALGMDTTIRFGDSIRLNAQYAGSELASYTWTSIYPIDPNTLTPWVTPLASTDVDITVVDTAGCTASDRLRILVERPVRVFVPNIVTPESGDNNAFLTVYGGAEVRSVRYLRVYDRWGDLVFENTAFSPDDPNAGWNGRSNNRLVAPGVYVYITEVEYIDGATEVFSGDVTVLR